MAHEGRHTGVGPMPSRVGAEGDLPTAAARRVQERVWRVHLPHVHRGIPGAFHSHTRNYHD
jgi:hypothetical protein